MINMSVMAMGFGAFDPVNRESGEILPKVPADKEKEVSLNREVKPPEGVD
jgi:hypothetical protein